MRAVPWLRRLVAGLSPRRLGFAPGSVHVVFVVGRVALGECFLRSHCHSSSHHCSTYLSPPHEVSDSSDQTAHYHTVGPKSWPSPLIRHLAAIGEGNILFILFYYLCWHVSL
jgi:hypothetical protein